MKKDQLSPGENKGVKICFRNIVESGFEKNKALLTLGSKYRPFWSWKASLLEDWFDKNQLLLFTWANFYKNQLQYLTHVIFELRNQLQFIIYYF